MIWRNTLPGLFGLARSAVFVLILVFPLYASGADDVSDAVDRGLRWLAASQSRVGHWEARDGRYPTAMTALSGMALLAEGSTTTQGPYDATSVKRLTTWWGRVIPMA